MMFDKIVLRDILLGLVVSLTVIILSSWITSGRNTKPKTTSKGSLPPEATSWIPLFGSLSQYVASPVAFLQAKRNEFRQGLYSLTLGFRQRTVIYSRDYLRQIDELPDAAKDSTTTRVNLLSRGFSLSSRLPLAFEEIYTPVQKELGKVFESTTTKLISDAVRNLERRMPHLISFLENPIDYEPWERMSGTVLLEDGKTVETGLIALTQTFLAFFTTEQLLAPSLFEQQPQVVPLTLTLISHLEKLLLKPKLLAPHPQAVLRAILPQLGSFLDSVSAMSEEEPTDYIALELLERPDTPFLQILRLKEVQSAERNVQGSLLASLLGLSMIPHTLVPWTILRILAPKSELSIEREEIEQQLAKSVSITQDEGINNILPPPTVKVEQYGLTSCSQLISDAIELYARGWDEVTLKQDTVLSPVESSSPTYFLPEGSHVFEAYWMCEPKTKGERLGIETAIKQLGLFYLPPLAPYLSALYPTFIAIFLRLYDVEPVESWTIPEAKFSPGVALPTSDIRVKIKRKPVAKSVA